MTLHRIDAILIRHLYLYRRSFPRLMDIFYWPVMDLLVWGFLSAYLDKAGLGGFNAVTVLLGAMIFWDLLSHAQKAVSVAFLEDIWERNLLNIFVTPLRVSEFLSATAILALIRIFIIALIMGLLGFLFYGLNIFRFGFYLIPFLINLLIFGSVLGIFVMGVIIRYGTQAQILAFGFIFLIQPFAAVFYPVSALPAFLQPISYLIPASYVFEGMRAVIADGTLSFSRLGIAFAVNSVYLCLAILFFYLMFARAKRRGALLKLE